MSLVVPPEYAKDVSKHSGFLNSRSKWANKTLKGLWRGPANISYLSEQLFTLVTHPQYIHDHSKISSSIGMDISEEEQSNYVADGVKRGFERPTLRGEPFRKKHTKPMPRDYELAKQFKRLRPQINASVTHMIEEYVLPYDEELKTNNPIMELHYVNLDFLTSSAETIIQNPSALITNFNNWNDDKNTYDEKLADYEYSAESWNDGTWHPEHLFTQSATNRKTAYWNNAQLEIWNAPIGYPGEGAEEEAIRQADIASASGQSFMGLESENFEDGYTDASIGGRGPGNRYKHIALPDLEVLGGVSEDRRGDDRGTYNNTREGSRRGRFAQGGQFPFWQTTMHQRPYDRDIDDGLREGGTSDRRTQTNRGYDMTDLTRRSSTQVNKVQHYRKK